jgi:hypothetical protein
MKRKEAVYKGLRDISVYFEDTSLTSPDYFQITEFPLRLTSGKNLFKLRGHPTNLKVGGPIGLEILDYNGNPIYYEIVDYIDEDKSRVIAIYIYTDTSPGDCTITIIAESNVINGEAAPQEWQGRPNVKWSRSVPVNPNVSNISEIIFESAPTVTVDEIVGVQLNRIYSGSTQFPIYTTGTVNYFSYNNQPAISITGGLFTSDMSTGTITVATPINPLPTPNYTVSTTPYISTIKKILSPTTALLDTEYTAYSSQSIASHTFTSFNNSTFSLAYEATPTYVATQNSQSFAYIQINGLDPSTGDVSRIKVFTNNNGTVGSYELVNDVELTETEIFIANTASLYPDTSIGLFTSQSIIDAYWSAAAYQSSTVLTPPTLVFNTASIDNAMKISSSINLDATNTVLKIQNTVPGIFIENSSYKVTIDALGTRTGSIDPVLAIYVSGSSFYQDPTDFFNQQFPTKFGKRIGELRVTGDNQRFDDQVINFESDYTGTGVLQLVVESGNWQVADIRTTTDNDAGYSPNYTRIKTLIQTTHKIDNQISFKVEYYNVNGEKSKQTSYVYNKDWEGGNRYIDGNYSMLTGSLYVADSLESGIAISGYPNSGFIRSLGYEGFNAGYPGFLLWSGSALPGSSGTKGGGAYSGVGLEMYANTSSYFRYSTKDSEIDVRTNKFFFGNPSSSFISGSNNNLQISSSGFILSPQGNVTASSFIAVNGSTVLFDTNNQFADGLNIGRLIYFDPTEYTYNMSTLPTTASGVTGSSYAGPVFETFILPGETNMQISYTYSADRTDATSGNRTLRISSFIANAISGSNTGLGSYGKFNNQANLQGNQTIDSVGPISSFSGARTAEIKGISSGIINSQGYYVLVHTIIHVSNNTSLTGTLKLKNFVFRTSRTVGGSLAQPAGGPLS